MKVSFVYVTNISILKQGCVLTVPGCHSQLTFVFRRGQAEVLGTPDFMVGSLWVPCAVFLRAQLCLTTRTHKVVD